jgi:PAS domain S-box-containing protein
MEFNTSQLNYIFPFHVQIDENLKISKVGNSLIKLIPDIIDKNFNEVFTINRPYMETVNFELLKSKCSQFFILSQIQNNTNFRGELLFIEDTNLLLFIGIPWIQSLDHLSELNLLMKDFAPHDSTFDLLHIIKIIEINSDEIKVLLKKLEEKSELIAKSEALYKETLYLASDIIYKADIKARFIYVNPALVRVTGYTEAELLSMRFIDIIQPEYRLKTAKHYVNQRLQNISSSYFEFPIITKSNEIKWIGQSVQMVKIEENPIFTALAIDITKQKIDEFALIETNKKLELLNNLLDNTLDAIYVYYESGQVVYINKEGLSRLGLENDKVNELFVVNVEPLFQHENSWIAFVNDLKLEEKKVLFGEGINKDCDAETFPVEVTFKYIKIDNVGYIVATSRDITERRLAEIELLNSNQKLESILNEMTDVVWSAPLPDYQLIFATPSFEKLFGEVLESWYDNILWWEKVVYHEDAHIIPEVAESLSSTGTFQTKHRIINNNGEIKWVSHSGKIVRNQQNEPIRLDGVMKDITSQVYVEDMLNMELQLQEILIDIAATYINLDLEMANDTINESLKKLGQFVSADRAYIFEYDFNLMTTSNTYEWCNDGVNAEIQNLQNISIQDMPHWISKHQLGEAFYIPNVAELEYDPTLKEILLSQSIKSLIAIPMLDGKNLMGFIGFDSVKKQHQYSTKEKSLLFLFGQMLINIVNRQKWEKQLTLQEEKFRNIIAHMNLGLLEVDNNDVILFANQSFTDISGYSLSDLKGKKAASLFFDNNQTKLLKEKQKNRLEGISDSYEVEVTINNGEKRWWLISGAPNFDDKGNLIGSIGIHLDITAQKQLEQELAKSKSFAEAAALAKELFLANMSHEIRTPLNVIIGMIRQLTKENLNEQQIFYVRKSESSARHLLNILNDILDVAKIESGELEVFNNHFSLSALAHNIHSFLFWQTKEKNIDFVLNVHPGISPVLLGDEVRLKQVIINLIGNAIKFTNKGSIQFTITLKGEVNNKQIIGFEIRDTGIGMSAEFIEKIFDKFSQEQDHANRKFEGTGLGMAISNDLVSLMGGQLKVESAKGFGTRCWFELELTQSDQSKLILNSDSVTQNAFLGNKVLIVEDNEMNRFIALQSLTYVGCEVVEAENGKVAVEILKSTKFDLILMDIQMPEMDGVEATRIIRNQLNIQTPIIALTANAFKHEIDLYLAEGMNDFITKPYDEQEFFRKINLYIKLDIPKGENYSKKMPKKKEPLYDLTYIKEVSRGNNDFILKMVNIFCELVQSNTIILDNALKEQKIELLGATIHKMKPSIDQMGIISLKDKVRNIEKLASTKIFSKELVDLTELLISTLRNVVEEIKKEHDFSIK